MSLTQDELNKLAFTVCPHINKTYTNTLAALHQDLDLPGVWPKFYLYEDLTWSLGFEQEDHKSLLMSLDVRAYGNSELIGDLCSSLPKDFVTANSTHIPPAKEPIEHRTTPTVARGRIKRVRTTKPTEVVSTSEAVQSPPKRRKRIKNAW